MSGSRALLLRRSLVSSRHVTTRARAGCGNEPSRSFFLLFRKNAVLTDASQLVSSGRYRIVGYCNRPERNVRTWTQPTSYPLGFPEPALYKVLHDLATEYTENQSRVLPPLCLRRLRSLLHPERRRAPANGRAGLRNHSPLRSCTGEGE